MKFIFKKSNLILLLLSFSSSYGTMSKKFLIYGAKTGWIGKQLIDIIQNQGHVAVVGNARIEDRTNLQQEIIENSPDFVINAAGVTGRPNVDWCEDHKQETIRSNIVGALNLADVCYLNNVHMTNLGTGCIFEYDETHPAHSTDGFTEEDTPNFDGSFYSKTKIVLEKLLLCYPNVLNLRLRMPVSSDFNERNFIVKISKYQRIINVPNSITILDDLLPLIPQMAIRKLTGVYNFVNPGTISHNEVLDLYKQYIDPAFVYKNFTIAEQNIILKAKRSNNKLDTTKLLKEFPNIPEVHTSMINVVKKMKKTISVTME